MLLSNVGANRRWILASMDSSVYPLHGQLHLDIDLDYDLENMGSDL